MDMQTFKTPDGNEMVILPKAQYEALLKRCSFDAPDNAYNILRRVEAGTEPVIPIEVYKLMREQKMSRIRAFRKYRGMTEGALAKAIGKSLSYITQIENGTRTGSIDTLAAIAKALKTSVDSLR